MIVAVEVGVALSRPPKLDRISRILVEVDFTPWDFFTAEVEAQILACWIAAARPEVVMAVSATVTDILEI